MLRFPHWKTEHIIISNIIHQVGEIHFSQFVYLYFEVLLDRLSSHTVSLRYFFECFVLHVVHVDDV